MTTYITIPGNPVALPVTTAANLPTSGEMTGQTCLVIDTHKWYYWDGSAWQQV